MVDVASNIMLADERVLWLAQREAKACSRIVQCLQRIATHRLASGAHVYSTVSATLSQATGGFEYGHCTLEGPRTPSWCRCLLLLLISTECLSLKPFEKLILLLSNLFSQ